MQIGFDLANRSLGQAAYDLESGFPPSIHAMLVICTEVETISRKYSKLGIAHTTDKAFVR